MPRRRIGRKRGYRRVGGGPLATALALIRVAKRTGRPEDAQRVITFAAQNPRISRNPYVFAFLQEHKGIRPGAGMRGVPRRRVPRAAYRRGRFRWLNEPGGGWSPQTPTVIPHQFEPSTGYPQTWTAEGGVVSDPLVYEDEPTVGPALWSEDEATGTAGYGKLIGGGRLRDRFGAKPLARRRWQKQVLKARRLKAQLDRMPANHPARKRVYRRWMRVVEKLKTRPGVVNVTETDGFGRIPLVRTAGAIQGGRINMLKRRISRLKGLRKRALAKKKMGQVSALGRQIKRLHVRLRRLEGAESGSVDGFGALNINIDNFSPFQKLSTLVFIGGAAAYFMGKTKKTKKQGMNVALLGGTAYAVATLT